LNSWIGTTRSLVVLLSRSCKRTAILYSDVAETSALLATFVTAFVALAPDRVKTPDYSTVLGMFSAPLALFSLALALAVVELTASVFALYGGLIALFTVFLLTIQRIVESVNVPPPPVSKVASPGSP
jgi:hypothetical protein